MTVVGIDACSGGWVGIVLDGAARPTAVLGRTVAALLEAAPPVAMIAIDIPIGLLEEGARGADLPGGQPGRQAARRRRHQPPGLRPAQPDLRGRRLVGE